MRTTTRARVLAALLLLGAACVSNDPIRCDDSTDCSQAGIGGQCLASPESSEMWCAFPDSACEDSGLRWGILSGDGLARECVGGTPLGDGGLGFTVTVTSSGDGSGVVRSTPEGIDCGSVCSHAFPAGTPVELSATAAPAAFFEGWSGACAGRDVCTVDGTSGSVGAEFLASGGTRWLTQVTGMFEHTAAAADVTPEGDIVVAGIGNPSFVQSVVVQAISGSTGEIQWTRAFPGEESAYLQLLDVAVDSAGDIIISGIVETSVNFDGSILTAPGGSINAGGGIFVAKLSGADGTALWATSFGRVSYYGHGPHLVAVDSQRNIYVAGNYADTFSLAGTTLLDRGTYLARFTAAGVPSWAISVAQGDVLLEGLALDSGNNVAVVGNFVGSTSLGGEVLNSEAGTKDVFLARYSAASGGHVSHVSFRIAGQQRAIRLLTTPEGTSLLLGTYEGAPNFGGNTLPGPSGVFVVELSPAGAHLSSFGVATSTQVQPSAFALGTAGVELWISGGFNGSASFGGTTITSASGSQDGFLAKYSRAGVHRFSTRFGGTGSESARFVVRTPSALLTGGSFQGFAEFGADTLTSDGPPDTFLWSIVP